MNTLSRLIGSRHWQRLRNILFLAAISLTIYFGLFDYFEPPFRLSSELRGPGDRHLHMIALASMTLILMVGQKKTLLLFACMTGFAVALEFAQIWLPDRAASIDDLFASLAGVALGGLAAIAVNHFLQRLKRAS